jgi:hypothetical protein
MLYYEARHRQQLDEYVESNVKQKNFFVFLLEEENEINIHSVKSSFESNFSVLINEILVIQF